MEVHWTTVDLTAYTHCQLQKTVWGAFLFNFVQKCWTTKGTAVQCQLPPFHSPSKPRPSVLWSSVYAALYYSHGFFKLLSLHFAVSLFSLGMLKSTKKNGMGTEILKCRILSILLVPFWGQSLHTYVSRLKFIRNVARCRDSIDQHKWGNKVGW